MYEAIVHIRNSEKKIKAAQLLEELQQFESKKNWLELHDPIGDLGNTLTSGQKKILMYCRALLTNKPWIIIDQPFKNLNPKTVAHIKNILYKLKTKKTFVILDTKIPEGIVAENIYKIENGTVIKQE